MGRTDKEPQFIFPAPVYPLSQFLEPGHGTAGSWKRQPWHKSRAKKKRRRRAHWQAATSSPVLEEDIAALDRPPPPPPPPRIFSNPYGEPIYKWFPLTVEERQLARSRKRDKLPLTGGMRRRPGPAGLIEVVKQFSDLNGPDFKQRIGWLGLTTGRFANRNGMSSGTVAGYFRKHAGKIPLHVVRLLEFEEFLAVIARLVDAYDPAKIRAGPRFKKRIEALLEAQIGRLP